MTIADQTAEGIFVGFDGERTKLHNMRAYEAGHLLAGKGVNSEETQPLPFIADMVGRTYQFRARVNSYYFPASHQTLTISRILSEGAHLPLPKFVANNVNDDDGDDISGNNTVSTKVVFGGNCGEGWSSIKTSSAGRTTKNPPTLSASDVLKKARLA